jgi:soluble lytic murein transglycosylase
VNVDVQHLATTRLLLRSDPVRGEQEAGNLPPALRNDPGLIFDEARALRQRNDIAPIAALLARAPTRELAKLNPGRWWAELNIDVRAALQLGFTRDAYWLAASAGLPADSGEYAEAEFLAGWIALREQNQPRLALSHFENLGRTSTHPISRARAHYWIARAHEAAGNAGAAWQEYRAASQDPGTFYGQLALAKITPDPSLHISATAVDASGERTPYEREDLTQAVHVLADLGLETALREFALQDVAVRPDAAHVKLLAEDLTRMGFRDIAVRVAKEASYNGVHLADYSHPVISVPRYSGPGDVPETAFVLAIIRQETEFDPVAVSGAGARGIMQLMPDSARRDAGLAGLSYNLSSLTADAAYNIELGMTELAGDLSEWGGSYVLAAASYNAGRGNVRKWIATFGDPRDARIDPVDWIEQIPFGETRNYVQRVIENMQVYRNRLAGRDEPLRILADLYRPMEPRISLLRYAPPDVTTIVPEPKPQPAAVPPGPSGTSANAVESRPTVPAAPAPTVTPTFKPTPGTPGSSKE